MFFLVANAQLYEIDIELNEGMLADVISMLFHR